jgi:ACR3 family arsenite transporter
MPKQDKSPLGIFPRYLSLWVALTITLGIVVGNLIPSIFQSISRFEYANVNFVVAVLIWVMIYPMMIQIDFSSLKNTWEKPKGLCVTLVVNWLIKPFTMAALAVLFFKYIFVAWVNPEDAKEYIAGMILLGVAPCTAMVFVWSQLTKGDPSYTLVQVSINNIIMIFAFAPIAAFLLGVTDVIVPWQTLLLSIILYVVIPLLAGYLTRQLILKQTGKVASVKHFSHLLEPYSILGLLLTVVLLFGFQAEKIIHEPFVIGLIAIPLIIQSYLIFIVAYAWSYFWKLPHNIAAPAALIGTSNFFELAVAVAISLFGLESGASLATVVGVLVEVPVMLSLVAFANNTRRHFK